MKTKQKVTWLICILIVAFGAFGFLIVLPLGQDILELNRQIDDEQLALEQSYDHGQNLRVVRKTFSRIVENVSVLSSAFVPQDGELDFIDDLEANASRSSVSLVVDRAPVAATKKSAAEAKKSDLISSSYVLQATGGFSNLIIFLNSLERMQTYLAISRIDFHKADPSHIIATMNATAFSESP